MSDIHELKVHPRLERGTRANRRLRRVDGLVPAIIYGTGKEPLAVSLDQLKLIHALEDEGFYSRILTLKLDDQSIKVVLKDLQRHPYKPHILHADFFRISATEKLTMTIPLHFIGEDEAPGIKEGGVVAHLISDIEVQCLPADLPEYIEVDLSGLHKDETLHLSQLKLPKGIELVALSHGNDEEHDQGVVTIHEPRIAELEEDIEENAEAETDEQSAEDSTKEDEDESPTDNESSEG